MVRRTSSSWFDKVGSPLAAVATFIGGGILAVYLIGAGVATKPYVDAGLVDVRKYTDEKGTVVLREAFDHSDLNRAQVEKELESYRGDIRQLTEAVNNLKITVDQKLFLRR